MTEKTEFQKLIDHSCERMIESIMVGTVRGGVVDICHAVSNWAREQEQKRKPTASNGFEAIHHGSHIVQFGPNVFVWYDEAAAPRGVETTLLGAQRALQHYGEVIDKPKSLPEHVVAALIQPLEELPPPGSKVKVRSFLADLPGKQGRASIWFEGKQISHTLYPENALGLCARMGWITE